MKMRWQVLRSLGFVVYQMLWSAGSAFSAETPPLAIDHVTIVDVRTSELRADQRVMIQNGKITRITRGGEGDLPPGTKNIDGAGKFLIPGLWDMHVHLTFAGETSLPVLVKNGVTSVRDMGGDFEVVQGMRKRIAAGEIIGPRIFTPGPMLESPRFVQAAAKLTNEDLTRTRIAVPDPASAAGVLDHLKAMGVDFVKIRNAANKPTYLAIVEETKRHGLTLVGHLPPVVSYAEASDAGQKSIEHGFFPTLDRMSEAEREALAEEFVKNGTRLVPTFIAGRNFRLLPDEQVAAIIADDKGVIEPRRKFISPDLAKGWAEQMGMKKAEKSKLDWNAIEASGTRDFKLMHKKGVKIMPGTDLGVPLVYPGSSLHEELQLLVSEAGLTPLEALQSATIFSAEFFGLTKDLGTVEEGKIADLVLLSANPLSDIRNTATITAVIVDGRGL